MCVFSVLLYEVPSRILTQLRWYLQVLRRLFDLIDVDGDNEVSKREVLQAVRTDGRGNHLVRALVEQSSANIQV